MTPPDDVVPEEENPFAPEVDSAPEAPYHLDADTRAAIVSYVLRHIKRYGQKKWARVYEEFSEIPHRTVRRWIDKVLNNEVTDEDILVSSIADAKRGAKKLAGMIPVAPPPTVIAAKGIEARRSIDFMAQLQEMLSDLAMLREFSMSEKDGKKGIRNAMYFSMSIKLRKEVVETCIRAMQAIWELGRMEDMYNIVIEKVGESSPELQREIMEALEELNDSRGMTINANPRR